MWLQHVQDMFIVNVVHNFNSSALCYCTEEPLQWCRHLSSVIHKKNVEMFSQKVESIMPEFVESYMYLSIISPDIFFFKI